MINEWFSGRKTTALDNFVVGTVDQFLMIALKQKHLTLRHLGFSKKVIVIDEVHAYDVYMSQYLKRAISWAASYNVPVIILSATLLARKRIELIECYLKGKGSKTNEIISSNIDLNTNSYPLVTYNDGNIIKQFSDFEKKQDKEIEVVRIESEVIYEKVNEMSDSDGVIGIIVNTVKRAQELAQNFIEQYGSDTVILLHSSFIAFERIRKETELLNIIGKGKPRPDFKIVIGTQVIEQSLDICFDVLFTDLCPIDLLIQRLGRLHRHNRVKPKMHEKPRVFVMGTNNKLDFEDGAKYVYGGYVLTRSQYFLPTVLKIPGDISVLVQKVYSDELEIDLPEELLSIYENYKKDNELELKRKKRRAGTYLLNMPSYRERASMIDWLRNSGETSWENSEEQGNNQVRDTQESIEVIALKEIGDGYGTFDDETDLSSSVLNNSVAKKLMKNTLRLPRNLTMHYNIENTIKELEEFNNKYLSSWRQSPWLRGSLGIIFDKDNVFRLNGYILRYNNRNGLTYERWSNGEI